MCHGASTKRLEPIDHNLICEVCLANINSIILRPDDMDMNKDKVQHVFFDLDNTLWDHRGNSDKVLEKMFKDYEIEEKYELKFDAWLDVFENLNELLWQALSEGEITKAELRERRFQDPFMHFQIDNKALSEEFEDIYLKRMGKMSGVVEGANEILEYLSENYTIHIITNGFEEVSEPKTVNSDMKKYIETLTCADEIGIRKPDPRIFALAMEKAGSTKENSIIIGDDWIADIIGGTGFGWQAIFFDVLNEENNLDGVPTIKNLAEIKNLL